MNNRWWNERSSMAVAGLIVLSIVLVGGCRRDLSQKTADWDQASVASIGDNPSRVSRLVVNGEVVTVDEILKPIRADLVERSERLPRADYQRYTRQIAFRKIRDRIIDIVLYQKASLRLSSAHEDALDQMVDAEMRTRIADTGNGTLHGYQQLLDSRNTTMEEERQLYRRQIIVQRYLQLNVLPKVQEPTRSQLLAIFDAGKEELNKPERRKMSLIEVRLVNRTEPRPSGSDPSPVSQQRDAARGAARKIIYEAYEQVKSGSDFSDTARRLSDGINARGGGSWGWVGRDAVRPRWEIAARQLYALDAGRMGEVLETDDGFFLVRCDEIQEAVAPSFEAMQPELIEQHRNSAYNQLINELIASLVDQAHIEPPDIEPFIQSIVAAAP